MEPDAAQLLALEQQNRTVLNKSPLVVLLEHYKLKRKIKNKTVTTSELLRRELNLPSQFDPLYFPSPLLPLTELHHYLIRASNYVLHLPGSLDFSLKVSVYFKPELDWEQAHAIVLGMIAEVVRATKPN